MATYCISDIHGDFERYQEMLQLIQFTHKDTLYILGDVIDRNADGVKILMDIIDRVNVFMILGNHEEMCLQVFTSPYNAEALQQWRYNGGSRTYADLKYRRTPDARSRIFQYLRKLPDHLDIVVNDRAFHLVHGYPGEETMDRIWNRPEPDGPAPFSNKTTIIGHTPTSFLTGKENEPLQIWHGNGIIDIDCGCGNKNKFVRLACLRLDDMAEFYV